MIQSQLSKLLVENNITWHRIAKELGVKEETFKNWINGIDSPDENMVKKIADIMNMDCEDLQKRLEENCMEDNYSEYQKERMRIKKLGKYILKLRIEMDLTRNELANRLGVTYATIKDWEEGCTEPNQYELEKLRGIIHIPVTENNTEENYSVDESEIKIIREKTGMNKVEFATYFDIPVDTLQQWESGRRNPPTYVVSLIKRVIELENDQYRCSFSLEDAIDVAYKNYQENKSMEIVYGDLLFYKNKGKLDKFLANPSKYPYNFLKELMDMLK